MPHTDHPNLTVLDHPLVQHKISLLRSTITGPRDFKALANEIVSLMTYEATKELALKDVNIETPLETTVGRQLAEREVALAPILRAGLGMVDGVARMVPNARVGHIGLYRDESSLEPVPYYFKMPDRIEERLVLVLDPMLATGGSAVHGVDTLKQAGAVRIRFLCLVAAPEGVRSMHNAHPDVPIYTAALDRQLNDRGFILPGLGDAGDRLFGTR